jgi:sugar O-acyltransferase (sialic acid O-acetyltransferase NeuD family)
VGLVIVGAGGFGREILDVLDAAEGLPGDFVGFVDDSCAMVELIEAMGERLLGSIDVMTDLAHEYFVGVGDPAVRRSLDEKLVGFGCVAAQPARHRTASIGRLVQLGPGTVVCGGANITTNIVAGRHLHVNLGATIGHDCVIGDFVTLAPSVNISGNVTIGDCVEFGTAAVVLPGLTIGAGATVGAGAVVTKSVEPGVTVVGVPARALRVPS